MTKKRYADYSFWLEDAGDLTPRRPLQRSEEVDVAVIEREIAGYGASGRNGGWCSPRFPVTAGVLTQRFGDARTRALLLALNASVDAIRAICDEEAIDACLRA